MKFFIFMILIPVLTGVITAANGLSIADPDTRLLYLVIVAVVCFISTSIYWLIK